MYLLKVQILNSNGQRLNKVLCFFFFFPLIFIRCHKYPEISATSDVDCLLSSADSLKQSDDIYILYSIITSSLR